MLLHGGLLSIYLVYISALSAASELNSGVNFQPSYFNNGNVTFGWDLLKTFPQIKTIRIEIEPDKVEQAKKWLGETAAHGYSIIATHHNCSVLGSDDPNVLWTGADWWVQNYKYLSENVDFTINVMNEWGSYKQTAESYASAYNEAVSRIRSVYPSTKKIVLDSPGWGQEAPVAAKASPLLTDDNIVHSVHVYPWGWNARDMRFIKPSDLDDLQATGRPCIIGEFGTLGNGNCNVEDVVNHAKEDFGWPVMAWAWNGDGTMDICSPSWNTDPTASSYSVTDYGNSVLPLL